VVYFEPPFAKSPAGFLTVKVLVQLDGQARSEYMGEVSPLVKSIWTGEVIPSSVQLELHASGESTLYKRDAAGWHARFGRSLPVTAMLLVAPVMRNMVTTFPTGGDDLRLKRRSDRKVLKALRNSDVIEITVPLKFSPDPVFSWSLEGASEAIAQACPGR